MKNIVEICCGSYYDALMAYNGGAKRIELNSALHLGGLTPSLGTLKLVKEHTELEVICMLRPRGAGFCYNNEDFMVMMEDCKLLLEHGACGIAFGCLDDKYNLDMKKNKEIIKLIKQYNGVAVFHRAFDCVTDPDIVIKQLIELGIDRILTSGLKAKAQDGIEMIKYLQATYGDKIEILAGSGINAGNVKEIIEFSKINQVHSSCKDWILDLTTSTTDVSYSYGDESHKDYYDVVNQELVKKLIKNVIK